MALKILYLGFKQSFHVENFEENEDIFDVTPNTGISEFLVR